MRSAQLLAVCCAAAALAGATASAAWGQGAPGGGFAGFDPTTRLIVIVPASGFASDMIVGANRPEPGAYFIYFVELNGPLITTQGCQHLNPLFENLVACPPPPQARGIRFEPGPQRKALDIELPYIELPPEPEIEPLPEALPIEVGGSPKGDEIAGSPNTETINTGKGRDNVNPGDGRDDANLGPGKDKADTRDGDVDRINGGKGKDTAAVDRKDRVKNVEVVRRK